MIKNTEISIEKKLTVQNIPQVVFYCKEELAFQISKNCNVYKNIVNHQLTTYYNKYLNTKYDNKFQKTTSENITRKQKIILKWHLSWKQMRKKSEIWSTESMKILETSAT